MYCLWLRTVNFNLRQKLYKKCGLMDRSTLEGRVTNIEKQLHSLSKELADIKRILSLESEVIPRLKRTLSDDSDGIKKLKYEFTADDESYVHVYTDGACENNGKKGAKAGLGVWFADNHPLNISEPVRRRPTNNVAEIEACTRAIQQAHSAGVRKLYINTDSQFVINCITKWIHGWKKKGWKTASGDNVINKEELCELETTIKLMDGVKWNHVRGHQGNKGNEKADELARKGALLYKF